MAGRRVQGGAEMTDVWQVEVLGQAVFLREGRGSKIGKFINKQ